MRRGPAYLYDWLQRHGSLSKSKRSMLRHEWVRSTHTLTLSTGRRPALNRTFTFSNSAIPTLVLAPITDPDAGHSNTLLDFCIFPRRRHLSPIMGGMPRCHQGPTREVLRLKYYFHLARLLLVCNASGDLAGTCAPFHYYIQ